MLVNSHYYLQKHFTPSVSWLAFRSLLYSSGGGELLEHLPNRRASVQYNACSSLRSQVSVQWGPGSGVGLGVFPTLLASSTHT